MTEKWEDVRVTVIRPGPVDSDGPCGNAIPQDDFKATSLQPGKISDITLLIHLLVFLDDSRG